MATVGDSGADGSAEGDKSDGSSGSASGVDSTYPNAAGVNRRPSAAPLLLDLFSADWAAGFSEAGR